MKQYDTYTLPCGLRIICEQSDSPVLYCGYVVCAGTRHEEADDSGMAHFLEHMTFKGTSRRKAYQISNTLESVGGELNAYTTKQETVFHATVLKEDFARAADLLTDIVFHSTYPQTELVKEVEVVCDEIESYRDTPSDLIFDEFETMIYGGIGLGRDILGNADRLRTYTTADLRRFADKHYVPSNAVFFVYGQTDFMRVVKTLERLFRAEEGKNYLEKCSPTAVTGFSSASALNEEAERKNEKAPQNFGEAPQKSETASAEMRIMPPSERIVKKDTHQAHVLIGAPTFAATDPRRYALSMLNNILGGPGMNSRLNIRLRERAGLVYSVDSYVSLYPDTGYWNVYFGCDAEDVKRCRRMVERELLRFIEKPLSENALRAAKKQLHGQLLIGATSAESHALGMGKTFANFNKYCGIERIWHHFEALTAEDLMQVAETVYAPEVLTTLVYL